MDTSGLIWGEHLPGGKKGDYWSTGYYGVAPSVFRQMLDRLNLDWTAYTFVDVGCGKGRALMMALRYPFRKVLGVELSPQLVTVANANLLRFQADWRQSVPAEAISGDATRIELPDGPLVLYLYHPFAAPVMVQFLKRLRESLDNNPRSVYLLYLNPELDALLGQTPWLRKLWRECFPMLDDDIVADHFGSKEEYVVAYQAE